MLSNSLDQTFRNAFLIAKDYKHSYVTPDHLLIALIENREVINTLDRIVSIHQLKRKIRQYTELSNSKNISDREPKLSKDFQKIVHSIGIDNQLDENISEIYILAEFFFEDNTYSYLRDFGLSKNLLMGICKKKQFNQKGKTIKLLKAPHKVKTEQNELEKYCTNLNNLIQNSSIDRLIGRDAEIKRTIDILCRRKKNNVVLIGEPGVGKTAIAEGIASKIVSGKLPKLLKSCVVYALDIAKLVGGTKYRGDFEERMQIFLEKLKSDKNAILFIDEIHTIIGAGSTLNGVLDASSILKPVLTSGEIRCIGATTFEEYNKHLQKDLALVRRFQKVSVTEPDEKSSVKILKGIKDYYEQHHNVEYTDSALESAVTLAKRYIHNRYLPDKAIDLIDEAGSRLHSRRKILITNKHIEETLLETINIPSFADKNKLTQIRNNLKSSIFGREKIINTICDDIILSSIGLHKSNLPIGFYLFAGFIGVGKSEFVKQLAHHYNMSLLKFDMAEFSESNSISKLIGTSAGYIGFEKGGVLTSKVDKNPHSVILLNHLDKAHPDVIEIISQIAREGTIASNSGKVIDFSHSIILATVNLQNNVKNIGFQREYKSNTTKTLNLDKLFTQSFLDHFDEIMYFEKIDNFIDKIILSQLEELRVKLAEMNIKLIVNFTVKRYLAELCADSNNIRHIELIIKREVKHKIANAISDSKDMKNNTIARLYLSQKEDEIFIEFNKQKFKKTEKFDQRRLINVH